MMAENWKNFKQIILFFRYGSDEEEPEKEEKLLENREKPESLTTFVQSTRYYR